MRLWYNLPLMSEKLNIVKVPEQRRWVEGVTNLAAYGQFYRSLFAADEAGNWINSVGEYAVEHEQETGPDYFRLLATVGLLGGQWGFTSMTGQRLIHAKHRWGKNLLSPRHQLALASYLGHINRQSYPIKADLEKRMIEEVNRPEDAAIVWIKGLKVSNGKVEDIGEKDPAVLGRYLENLLAAKKHLPVLMPDPGLNGQLADLNFQGDDAESMTDEVFREKIAPQAGIILQGLVNAEAVFGI